MNEILDEPDIKKKPPSGKSIQYFQYSIITYIILALIVLVMAANNLGTLVYLSFVSLLVLFLAVAFNLVGMTYGVLSLKEGVDFQTVSGILLNAGLFVVFCYTAGLSIGVWTRIWEYIW